MVVSAWSFLRLLPLINTQSPLGDGVAVDVQRELVQPWNGKNNIAEADVHVDDQEEVRKREWVALFINRFPRVQPRSHEGQGGVSAAVCQRREDGESLGVRGEIVNHQTIEDVAGRWIPRVVIDNDLFAEE